MKIKIPHLAYTVHIKDAFHENMGTSASCERIDRGNCYIWIPKKIRKEVTTVVHEVVHAVQFISEARDINMVLEQEHIAYLVQYITAEILGIKLESK